MTYMQGVLASELARHLDGTCDDVDYGDCLYHLAGSVPAYVVVGDPGHFTQPEHTCYFTLQCDVCDIVASLCEIEALAVLGADYLLIACTDLIGCRVRTHLAYHDSAAEFNLDCELCVAGSSLVQSDYLALIADIARYARP